MSIHSLESLGADAGLLSAFAPFELRGLTLARVSLAARDEYRVLTGNGECRAEAAGILYHRAERAADFPAVGDWVAARYAGQDLALIEAVLPRRSAFSRRSPGKGEHEQVIAANIDTVFVVCGLDHDFNLRRLERYLTLAAESGAVPVVIINKTDLCDDLPAALAAAERTAAGRSVVAISARSEEGIAQLYPWIGPGRTVALLGSSGAGKSTLVNCLLGGARQKTAEVRQGDSRGRHTTTHRELFPLDGGGALIDNPGLRELQLWAGTGSLGQAFPEITALAETCRFGDCSHSAEPGCAVLAALESGALPAVRWSSYQKLLAEIRHHEAASDPLAALAVKQRWKAIHKSMKRFNKRDR